MNSFGNSLIKFVKLEISDIFSHRSVNYFDKLAISKIFTVCLIGQNEITNECINIVME